MKPKTLQIYLGWDPREDIAFQVARSHFAAEQSANADHSAAAQAS